MEEHVTWHTLERYREVIVHAADLLSFLLVTNELLQYSQPAIRRIVYWVGWIIFSSGLIYALPGGIGIVIAALVALVGFWFQRTYVSLDEWWQQHGEDIAKWVSARAFALGVCLFLTSRLFALVVSIHLVTVE
jgi:hypothetical protein